MDDALVGARSHNIIRLLWTFGLSLQLKSRKRVGGWRTPEGPLWGPKERKGSKGKERRQKMMPINSQGLAFWVFKWKILNGWNICESRPWMNDESYDISEPNNMKISSTLSISSIFWGNLIIACHFINIFMSWNMYVQCHEIWSIFIHVISFINR
jgi:hypothetical protein